MTSILPTHIQTTITTTTTACTQTRTHTRTQAPIQNIHKMSTQPKFMALQPTPIYYVLKFEPELQKATFKGTSTIAIQCPKSTKDIIMDCAELEITLCEVYPTEGGWRSEIPSTSYTDKDTEKLHISLRSPNDSERMLYIELEFNGILNDRLLGILP